MIAEYDTVQLEKPLFSQCERVVIVGNSGSGKTCFTNNLVKKHSEKFSKIIISGATHSELLEFEETKSKSSIYKGSDLIFNPFTELEQDPFENQDGKQILLIYDDLMNQISNSEIISDIFSRGRHFKLSILVLVQSYFPKPGNYFTIIKNNSTHQIFFRMRNQNEISLIAKRLEFTKDSQLFFLNIIKKYVQQVKWGYIAVFLEEVEERLRYRFNLLGEDGGQYQTIVTQ